MLRKSWTMAIAGILLAAGSVMAGTFGKVVSIGGAASDVALDEPRGLLYISNFTANRIEVMSLATNTIQTSINVAAQPSSISLSPDGRWLLVAHYGNNTAPASPQNGLTLIDLTANNAKQTFALGTPPLGVAFGIDNKALIVTTTEFVIFDPLVGSTRTYLTIQAAAAKAIPVPAANFPPNITGATVAASADRTVIYGLGDDLFFRFDVAHQALTAGSYSSSPPQGPRAISVAADGSYAASGWTVRDFNAHWLAEFDAPSGLLNVGGHAVDSPRGLIYSQVPSKAGDPPVLSILDADNLTLRERLQLPENLAGKTAVTTDGKTIYAVSDSGVLVLPVGSLNKSPRIAASAEDMIFRGNFCDRRIATQTLTITDPGGGSGTRFVITPSAAGVTVTPSIGFTPAVVRVTVDPNVFQNQKGTSTVTLNITSTAAVNIPASVRVLINSREPDQRGTFVNVPGKLVDLMADPLRNRYYVMRQDTNQVLVFDGANNTQIAKLRSCTKPMSMATTFDGRTLLIGCDKTHVMYQYDLDTLQMLPLIDTGSGYVQSVAVSNKAILAVMRDGSGGTPFIARIDPLTMSSSKPGNLGVFENKITLNSVLSATPNGSRIMMASSDGSVMLYDANVDTFTVSRKDFTALGGAYAASSFDQFAVGKYLLNSSLVQVGQLETATGNPSGFIFVDDAAIRTSAPDAASPGIAQRVNLSSAGGIRPTRMVEAPLLGSSGAAFTHSLAMLQNRSAFINLTTSGFTVLPPTYDAAVAAPTISLLVSAADSRSAAAPGGLISIYGNQLSPTNLATKEIPVPTALGDSCLTVNGQPMPLIFVSPNQINAQMPFQAVGNVTVIVHTPGGVSDNYNVTVQTNAPAVFRSGVAGPMTDLPTVVRANNNLLATDSNPVHRNDTLVIYLTGMGQVAPAVDNGLPAPSDPLATTLVTPTVTLGGVELPILYAGLAPGQVGVYQINATVPRSVPQGLSVPLKISQGAFNNSFDLRVVE